MASEAAPWALDVHEVSKRYGRRWALANVSVRLAAGRSLLLTGHNGSGKSTLLRLLATASHPSTGSIRVHGVDSREDAEWVRRHTSLLSHASFLYEDLSAEQNLTFAARLLGETEPVARVAELLSKVGLHARAAHPVRQFSAGMRKRLAIARLLLKAPRVALLDEPFGELDPAGIEWMEGVIRELQSQGCSVVLATHLIDQGQSLTHDRLHLEEGWQVAP